MSGKLVQVDTDTISSAINFIDLVGITTDDVYLLTFNNVNTSADCSILFRFLVSSSPDSSANYDSAMKNIRGDGSYTDTGNRQNITSINIGSIGTGTQEQSNGIIHIYNANESNEYSFMTCELTTRNNDSHLRGFQGGGVLTVAQATNGIRLVNNSGNFTSGTFTLYKVL